MECGCDLEPPRAGVGDVVGSKTARTGETADRHDQIVEAVREDSRLAEEAPPKKDLIDAGLNALASFRRERWVVREGDLEAVGRSDACPRRGTHLRRRLD